MTEFSPIRVTTPDGLMLSGVAGGPTVAPTVIFLHGGGQTRHSWDGAIRRLAATGYHVISFDSRGHGDSDWSPQGDYSLAAMASDLRAVIATVSGPVALVGASMGGMTSFYMVGSGGPAVVDALVIVDIVLRPASAGVEKIRTFMSAHSGGFADLGEASAAVAAYNPGRPRPNDPSGLMKNLRLHADERLYWHWDPKLVQETPSTEPPAFSDRMIDAAAGVTIPILLVRGGQSDIVDDDGVAEMCRLVPQTEVFVVTDAGHMVAGDRNDAFNDAVIAFLHRNLPLL